MKKKLISLSAIISLSIATSNYDALHMITHKDTNRTIMPTIKNNNMGDMTKGQKLFRRKIQKHCDISATEFASTYSQDEWEEIVEAGKFSDKIIEICPRLQGIYRDEWSFELYQFVYEYANDSGNIPSY